MFLARVVRFYSCSCHTCVCAWLKECNPGLFPLIFSVFFRTFFRQAAVKQGETRDRSLRARRPTGVGQDIALQRRAGVRVANVGGELAEACSERSLRCDCEHLPPPAPVRCCDRRALRRGAGESSALRDAVEEGLSLLAPSPSNLEGQHRETTPPGSLKLRVGYPMLALGSGSQGEAGLVVGARSAAPVSPQRADERHINRYLHASKGRESMRDDLEPAPVGQWQPEVQVAEEDVGRDPSSRLPADARRRGQARRTSTPAVGQAALWSPSSSRAPQRQARASSGSGRRRRRRSTQRKVSYLDAVFVCGSTWLLLAASPLVIYRPHLAGASLLRSSHIRRS